MNFKIENKIVLPINDPQLIVDALNSLGFIIIIVNPTYIKFKSNIKDNFVDSFQLKYGSGIIKYQQEDNDIKVSLVSNFKGSFLYSAIITSLLALFIGYAYVYHQKFNGYIYILSIAAILLSFSFEYYNNRSSISYKQKELLRIISDKINASLQQQV